MTTEINIESNNESEFVKKLSEIIKAVKTNTIEDYYMPMDGSYKIGNTTIEIHELESV